MIEFLNQISPFISAIATVVIAIYAITSHRETRQIAIESLKYQEHVRNIMIAQFGVEMVDKLIEIDKNQ